MKKSFFFLDGNTRLWVLVTKIYIGYGPAKYFFNCTINNFRILLDNTPKLSHITITGGGCSSMISFWVHLQFFRKTFCFICWRSLIMKSPPHTNTWHHNRKVSKIYGIIFNSRILSLVSIQLLCNASPQNGPKTLSAFLVIQDNNLKRPKMAFPIALKLFMPCCIPNFLSMY